MPEPPTYIPPPKRGAFTPSHVNDAAAKAVEDENRHNMEVYNARMRAYENQVNAKARQVAPAIRSLPVGYIRFSDDGKLCRVVKEWNTSGGTPADVVKALAAALGAQKGREVHIDNLGDSPCFLFPDTGRRVCAHAEGDGPASVMEMTVPCAPAPTPAKP